MDRKQLPWESDNPEIKKMLENAGGRPRFIPPRDYDHLFKLNIVGDSGVGQTALIRLFVDGVFSEGRLPLDYFSNGFAQKNIMASGKTIKLQIWDGSYLSCFINPRFSHLEGAHGVVIMYDVTDRNSFENVKRWLMEVDRQASENVKKLIIGNKCDLTTLKVVDFDTAKQFADELDIPLFETSCKTFVNIEQAFTLLVSDEWVAIREANTNQNDLPQTMATPGKKKEKCKIQ
jgi:Ras-related protein Rab-1A